MTDDAILRAARRIEQIARVMWMRDQLEGRFKDRDLDLTPDQLDLSRRLAQQVVTVARNVFEDLEPGDARDLAMALLLRFGITVEGGELGVRAPQPPPGRG
jgi:hypothetical protein